jgi:Holliday junction resolvase RusA-like endonuclease
VKIHTYRLTSPPPSDNRLHRVARGRIINSEEYNTWMASAGWEIQEQKHTNPQIEAYPVSIRVSVHDDSWETKGRDIGNVAKAIGDLLKHQAVIIDDSVRHVWEFRCVYGHGAPSYVVTIEEP